MANKALEGAGVGGGLGGAVGATILGIAAAGASIAFRASASSSRGHWPARSRASAGAAAGGLVALVGAGIPEEQPVFEEDLKHAPSCSGRAERRAGRHRTREGLAKHRPAVPLDAGRRRNREPLSGLQGSRGGRRIDRLLPCQRPSVVSPHEGPLRTRERPSSSRWKDAELWPRPALRDPPRAEVVCGVPGRGDLTESANAVRRQIMENGQETGKSSGRSGRRGRPSCRQDPQCSRVNGRSP
jgi:hypothetical protein